MTGSVNMLTMCPGPKRWLSSGNGKNPSRNPHTLNPDGKDRDVRLLRQRLGHPEHLEEMGVVAAGKDPPLCFLRVCGLHRCQCIDPHQHRSTVWHAHQHRSTVVEARFKHLAASVRASPCRVSRSSSTVHGGPPVTQRRSHAWLMLMLRCRGSAVMVCCVYAP